MTSSREVPPGGDLYLLRKVIHDWDDEHARRILRTCRAALSDSARLLMVEMVIPADNAPAYAKLLDLLMLVYSGGRERTEQEYRDLLEISRLIADAYHHDHFADQHHRGPAAQRRMNPKAHHG